MYFDCLNKTLNPQKFCLTESSTRWSCVTGNIDQLGPKLLV